MLFQFPNAPSTFQLAMNDLFRSYLCRFALIFFYDIFLYSMTWADHLEHLDCVLVLFCNHHFHVKQSKYVFRHS